MNNNAPNGESYRNTREKIQSRHIKGVYQNLRNTGATFFLCLYFLLPWIRWHDRQAILFDIPHQKFYFFGITFWPQDFILLATIFLLLIFALFFITTLAGRVWCGYVCPQTIWTKVYVWIARITEGGYLKRIRLDKSSLSFTKCTRRGGKHALWLLLAFVTAIGFVGYFSPIKSLLFDILTLHIGRWQAFFLFLITAGTYINAGWMRERLCVYLCPYARLQSAMLDPDTLIVSYDENRGEPRGPRPRGIDASAAGLGDCINCHKCVQVCPTGIDIRRGLQIACIGCAACIDACDSIMQKMHYPPGLIRYTTENELANKKTRILRPRLIANAIVLLLTCLTVFYLLSIRIPFRVNVLRDNRTTLYHRTFDGAIENDYTLNIINMSQKTQTYEIKAVGIQGLQYIGAKTITLAPNVMQSIDIHLQLSADRLSTPIQTVYFIVSLADNDKVFIKTQSRFIDLKLNKDNNTRLIPPGNLQ